MTFDELIRNINPDIYQNLKRALELGKWPDGKLLTQEQKEMCMEAVIVYEAKNLPEHERTGYMGNGPENCASTDKSNMIMDEEIPMRWKH